MYDFLISQLADFLDWKDLLQVISVNKQWHRLIYEPKGRFCFLRPQQFASPILHEHKEAASQEALDYLLEQDMQENNRIWKLQSFRNFVAIEPNSFAGEYRIFCYATRMFTNFRKFLSRIQMLTFAFPFLCGFEEPQDQEEQNHSTLPFYKIGDKNNTYTAYFSPHVPAYRHVKLMSVDPYNGNFHFILTSEPHKLYTLNPQQDLFYFTQAQCDLKPSLPYVKLQKPPITMDVPCLLVNSHPNVNRVYAIEDTYQSKSVSGWVFRICIWNFSTGQFLHLLQIGEKTLCYASKFAQHPTLPHLVVMEKSTMKLTLLQFEVNQRGCTVSYHLLPTLNRRMYYLEHIHIDDRNNLHIIYRTAGGQATLATVPYSTLFDQSSTAK